MSSPRAGGAEKTILEVGKYLSSKGHEIDLLTGGWEGASRHETIEGIHVHRYGNRLAPHVAHPAYLRYHREADIVIDDLAHAAPWFSPFLTTKPGLALFRHLHARTLRGQTSFPLDRILTLLERKYSWIYRKWPFVTHSIKGANDLIQLGVDNDKITVIPPGVDTSFFKVGKKTETPLIVYFGGMRPYKRPEHAIMALKLIQSRGIDANLAMVGEGPSQPFLKALAADMHIQDSVRFTGRLSDEELRQLVSESWVNVHCSLSEGWSISVMEAAASGVPTVAYRVPGISESVKDGVTGTLVDDGDLTSLSRSLEDSILASESSVAFRCREHALSYSWESVSKSWEKRLELLLSGA